MDLSLAPSPTPLTYVPSATTPSHADSPTPRISTPEQENFTEFIAFVGWYAFLILCCLVPTACAYQRRRRNARILHQSLANMQRRLEELDRMSGFHGIVEGGYRSEEMLDLGENRNRDWEFLERLFGGATNDDAAATSGDADGGEAEQNRRRMVLTDVLSGMSVRILVEREERRRRERGARLIALLKETSMEVQECHLVPKHNVTNSVDSCSININDCNNDNKQLEVENLNDKNDEVSSDSKAEYCTENITDRPDTSKQLKNECPNDKLDDDVTIHQQTSPSCSDAEPSTAEAQPNEQSTDNNSSSDETSQSPEQVNRASLEKSTISPHSFGLEASRPQISSLYPQQTEQQSIKINPPSSLYDINDPYIDEDDDDNPYSALALCNTPAAQSQSIRLVPPTCAICLTNYSIGCYVSWSKNSECTHAFHRDCILMWLLKKEEPLCPCCRREFVPSFASRDLTEDGVDADITLRF